MSTILIYSRDPTLSMTRRLILEKAGFRVFVTLDLSDAIRFLMNKDIALLMLCQSLRPYERRGVLATVRAIHPMKILLMEPDEMITVLDPHQEEILDALPKPSVLLAALRRMLPIPITGGLLTNLHLMQPTPYAQ